MTEKLIDGYRDFYTEYFEGDNKLFQQQLQFGQSPKSIMISCSDSRVDGAILTKAQPGDIFTIRNVANLVPPYKDQQQFNDAGGASVGAAIEFAVCALKVENIIVMGHSQCGGVKALMTHDDNKKSDFEYIPQWMNIAHAVKTRAENKANQSDDIEKLCQHGEHQMILLSLENLMTYPFISSRVKSGALLLHGWYFSIADGILYGYDKDISEFTAL